MSASRTIRADASVGEHAQAVLGKGDAQSVATPPLEALAVARGHGAGGVQ